MHSLVLEGVVDWQKSIDQSFDNQLIIKVIYQPNMWIIFRLITISCSLTQLCFRLAVLSVYILF